MSNKKLQVFVSSTFEDLKEERQAAVEAILSAGHIPAGMELFTAGDETQMTVIKRWIDESDVYLLILGGRYGSVEKSSGKSYTQLEYEYAVSLNKPLFAVVITDKGLDEKIKILQRAAIEQEYPQNLKVFKEEVKTKLVKFWDDKKDIKLTIHETLNDFGYRKELVGWVRDNAVSGNVAEELARLGKENEELKVRVNERSSSPNHYYSTLSYDELKTLLVSHNVTTKFRRYNAFEFMIKVGSQLSELYHVQPFDEEYYMFKKLLLFNIVADLGSIHSHKYKFTEDGQKFYLKTLALQNEENKNQNLPS